LPHKTRRAIRYKRKDTRKALLQVTEENMPKVINFLPQAQQEVIELAFFWGMSQREIAVHTNIPLGTVKTRLELGLKKIYDGLKELKDEF